MTKINSMATPTKKLKKRKQAFLKKTKPKLKEKLLTEWIRERLQGHYPIPTAELGRTKIIRAPRLCLAQNYYQITDRDFWNFRRTGVKHFMRLLYDDLDESQEFALRNQVQGVKTPLEIKGMLVIRMSTHQNARIPLTAAKWQEELSKKEIPYIYTKTKHDGVIWNGPWGFVQ